MGTFDESLVLLDINSTSGGSDLDGSTGAGGGGGGEFRVTPEADQRVTPEGDNRIVP